MEFIGILRSGFDLLDWLSIKSYNYGKSYNARSETLNFVAQV